MGNLFSTKALIPKLYGQSEGKGLFLKRPSIRNFAEVDYGKLVFRPGDNNTRYVVLSRLDNQGKRHQILFEEKFAKTLREAETFRNLDSESEVEGLNATSDEEAEQQRWDLWMRNRRAKAKLFFK